MRHETTVDLGAVCMHKKVIGDIAAAALVDIPGVQLVRFSILGSLFELFGFKNYPGVAVAIDKDGGVIIKLRLVVGYGMNIPSTAALVQDAVRSAIERSVEVELREINVNIHAVERRDV